MTLGQLKFGIMALGFIGISTFIFGFVAFEALDSDFLPAITDTCFYKHEKKKRLL